MKNTLRTAVVIFLSVATRLVAQAPDGYYSIAGAPSYGAGSISFFFQLLILLPLIGFFVLPLIDHIMSTRRKKNRKNSPERSIYVEYRKFRPFWGLFIDSEDDINRFVTEYTSKGWRIVQYHREVGLFPNISIFKMIFYILVAAITLGFLQFYVGPSFIFERLPDNK